jgi:hypothetical protein
MTDFFRWICLDNSEEFIVYRDATSFQQLLTAAV